MQVLGWIAIGCVVGFVAAVLFGRRVATLAVAEAKAVEGRLEAKLDSVKSGAATVVDDAKEAAVKGIEKL